MDDYDDTLAMLAAAIKNRKYPTDATMIMEESPGQERSTSQRPAIADLIMDDAQILITDQPANKPFPSTGMSDPLKQITTAKVEKSNENEDSRIIADQMKQMQDGRINSLAT